MNFRQTQLSFVERLAVFSPTNHEGLVTIINLRHLLECQGNLSYPKLPQALPERLRVPRFSSRGTRK
ncbi:hypothetical protein GQ44DRAFT_703445 [Phaeosphaeriaceae sp. PMI808]|nr:hypothetical protein GQ44DRAFT_703445 [Phaeosphaeriaceae sp. PMI808]